MKSPMLFTGPSLVGGEVVPVGDWDTGGGAVVSVGDWGTGGGAAVSVGDWGTDEVGGVGEGAGLSVGRLHASIRRIMAISPHSTIVFNSQNPHTLAVSGAVATHTCTQLSHLCHKPMGLPRMSGGTGTPIRVKMVGAMS